MKTHKKVITAAFLTLGALLSLFYMENRAEQKMLKSSAAKIAAQERHLEHLIKQYHKMAPLVDRLDRLFQNDLKNPNIRSRQFDNCFEQIRTIAISQNQTLNKITTMEWAKDRKMFDLWINKNRKQQFMLNMTIFYKTINSLAPWRKAARQVTTCKL